MKAKKKIANPVSGLTKRDWNKFYPGVYMTFPEKKHRKKKTVQGIITVVNKKTKTITIGDKKSTPPRALRQAGVKLKG